MSVPWHAVTICLKTELSEITWKQWNICKLNLFIVNRNLSRYSQGEEGEDEDSEEEDDYEPSDFSDEVEDSSEDSEESNWSAEEEDDGTYV